MTTRPDPSTQDLPAFPWVQMMNNPNAWALVTQGTAATEPAMRCAARAQLECSSLVGSRIKAWTAIPETLARCRTPVELMQAQVAFWQTAAHDYSTSTRQIMAAWAGMMPNALGEVERANQHDYMTFQEPPKDTSEERRRPGEARRAA